jgi:hypothetical protein
MIFREDPSARPQWWLLLATGLLLAACDLGPNNPETEMYVGVRPPEAERFTATLASILKDEGISASVGRTVDPLPATNHLLEGRSWQVRVWAQNAVLDPEEGVGCGYPPLSPVDQTQYVVSVQRRNPLSERRAGELFARLRAKLVGRGYKVTAQQMPCERLGKLPAS